MTKRIVDVKKFWEKNPLFTGESKYELGSSDFFNEHNRVYINDCFAGKIDKRILPKTGNNSLILDAGCGVGFWTEFFLKNNFTNIYSCDLTESAVIYTKKRINNIKNFRKVKVSQQNIESLDYNNSKFSWINCQGVLHHTPNPELAINEFSRVLKSDGYLVISVYHKSILLKLLLKLVQSLPKKFTQNLSLKGRGREALFMKGTVEDFIRMFDGVNNPIGTGYSKKEIRNLLEEKFEIDSFFKHYFPVRVLPFQIPLLIHKFLDKNFGLMIFVICRKKLY